MSLFMWIWAMLPLLACAGNLDSYFARNGLNFLIPQLSEAMASPMHQARRSRADIHSPSSVGSGLRHHDHAGAIVVDANLPIDLHPSAHTHSFDFADFVGGGYFELSYNITLSPYTIVTDEIGPELMACSLACSNTTDKASVTVSITLSDPATVGAAALTWMASRLSQAKQLVFGASVLDSHPAFTPDSASDCSPFINVENAAFNVLTLAVSGTYPHVTIRLQLQPILGSDIHMVGGFKMEWDPWHSRSREALDQASKSEVELTTARGRRLTTTATAGCGYLGTGWNGCDLDVGWNLNYNSATGSASTQNIVMWTYSGTPFVWCTNCYAYFDVAFSAAFAYCLNSGLTDPVFGMLGSCEHNMPFYNQYDSYINGDAFDIAFDVGVTASAGASFGMTFDFDTSIEVALPAKQILSAQLPSITVFIGSVPIKFGPTLSLDIDGYIKGITGTAGFGVAVSGQASAEADVFASMATTFGSIPAVSFQPYLSGSYSLSTTPFYLTMNNPTSAASLSVNVRPTLTIGVFDYNGVPVKVTPIVTTSLTFTPGGGGCGASDSAYSIQASSEYTIGVGPIYVSSLAVELLPANVMSYLSSYLDYTIFSGYTASPIDLNTGGVLCALCQGCLSGAPRNPTLGSASPTPTRSGGSSPSHTPPSSPTGSTTVSPTRSVWPSVTQTPTTTKSESSSATAAATGTPSTQSTPTGTANPSHTSSITGAATETPVPSTQSTAAGTATPSHTNGISLSATPPVSSTGTPTNTNTGAQTGSGSGSPVASPSTQPNASESQHAGPATVSTTSSSLPSITASLSSSASVSAKSQATDTATLAGTEGQSNFESRATGTGGATPGQQIAGNAALVVASIAAAVVFAIMVAAVVMALRRRRYRKRLVSKRPLQSAAMRPTPNFATGAMPSPASPPALPGKKGAAQSPPPTTVVILGNPYAQRSWAHGGSQAEV